MATACALCYSAHPDNFLTYPLITHRGIIFHLSLVKPGSHPFQCQQCGKVFVDNSSLGKHIAKHKGVKGCLPNRVFLPWQISVRRSILRLTLQCNRYTDGRTNFLLHTYMAPSFLVLTPSLTPSPG